MSLLLQDFQGNQEEYIKYLKDLLHELVEHHCHHHINCQLVPSVCVSTSRTALVTAQPEPVPEILTPPADTLPSSRHTRKRQLDDDDESTGELEIIFWQPSNNPPKPRDTGNQSWMPLAKKLVALTPLAAEWWEKAESLNLNAIMQGGVAAQFVLDGTSKTLSIPRREESEISYDVGAEEHGLLSAARAYAVTAANRDLTVKCVLMLVNFQKSVLLGICAVLSQVGACKSALVDITRICFGYVTPEYAYRLWRTAVIQNQLVDGLAAQKWGNRGSELLLIWNRSPTYYLQLTWAPDAALKYLITKLSTDAYTQGVGERKDWTNLFIPSLIYNILGQKIDIARISHHLGYQHPDMLSSAPFADPVNPWTFFRLKR